MSNKRPELKAPPEVVCIQINVYKTLLDLNISYSYRYIHFIFSFYFFFSFTMKMKQENIPLS